MLFFVLLSLAMMTLDHRTTYLHKVHMTLSVVVAPIQYLVDWPVRMVERLVSNIMSQRMLLQENLHLKAERLLLRAQVQKFIALQQENRQLRALLKSTSRLSERLTVAQLLAVDTGVFNHQLVLDKGKDDGVYVGQPVLDAYGVMGQVIQVGPLTSHVLLITDNRHAIPVENSRTGLRAIAVGTGTYDALTLLGITKTMNLKPGDEFITSGLGRRFPPGYPVGKVGTVNQMLSEQFVAVQLEPKAKLNHSRLVLLVWPEKQS